MDAPGNIDSKYVMALFPLTMQVSFQILHTLQSLLETLSKIVSSLLLPSLCTSRGRWCSFYPGGPHSPSAL